jgi:DNA-binding XRE family transcriptional regulator
VYTVKRLRSQRHSPSTGDDTPDTPPKLTRAHATAQGVPVTHTGVDRHALRDARRSQRMTARALAERAGLSPAYVSRLESGTRTAAHSPATVQALADALRVPVAWVQPSVEGPHDVSTTAAPAGPACSPEAGETAA